MSLMRLESRDTPAGIVTASFSKGVLTLIGDDAANVITNIKITPASTIITPDATTTIDDLAVPGPGTVNTPVTINGLVTGLVAVLKGGNDSITADPTTSISLSSGASIDLGDGDNVLDFTSSAKIDLAKVGVKAGEGTDTLTIKGGAGLGSQVAGSAAIAFGFGNSTTTLSDVGFVGSSGITVSGTGGTQTVTATNVTVTKTFTGQFGDGTGKLTFATSGLGGLKEAGEFVTATLNTASINGPIALAGVSSAVLTTNPATISSTVDLGVSNPNGVVTATFKGASTAAGIKLHGGQITMTAGNAAADSLIVSGPVSLAAVRNATLTQSKGTMTAKGVTLTASTGTGTINVNGTSLTSTGPVAVTSLLAASITGGAGSTTTLTGVTATSKSRSATITGSGTAFVVNGDVAVSGYLNATLDETAGTFSAGNVKITAGDTAGVTPAGTSLSVNGGLQVTGKLATNVTFGTTALSEVKGKIAVTGGPEADTFTATSKFKADQSVTLKLVDGNNLVSLGDTAGALGILGDLSILTGTGTDTVTIRQAAVGGKVSIGTGSGKDTMLIDDGSIFAGKFTADMGGGDDTITVAQDTAAQGSPGPVMFNGLTSFVGNTGNDTLLLGKATGAPGGDAKSAVQFAAGSILDGGLGLNVYDPTTAQTTGATIKNWP